MELPQSRSKQPLLSPPVSGAAPEDAPLEQWTRITVVERSDGAAMDLVRRGGSGRPKFTGTLLYQQFAQAPGHPVLDTFDLVAVTPLSEASLEHVVRSGAADMIALEVGSRLPFPIKKKHVRAVHRGWRPSVVSQCCSCSLRAAGPLFRARCGSRGDICVRRQGCHLSALVPVASASAPKNREGRAEVSRKRSSFPCSATPTSTASLVSFASFSRPETASC